MSKATALTSQDAQYKAQALGYLAEARRILRQLSAERRREERRRVGQTSILSEVKVILRGLDHVENAFGLAAGVPQHGPRVGGKPRQHPAN